MRLTKVAAAWLAALAAGGALHQPAHAQGASDPLPPLTTFEAGPRPDRAMTLPMPKVAAGTGMYWSSKDMLRAFGGKSPVTRAGAYAVDKEYKIFVTQRPANRTDAEMHQNMTQIYVVLSGTATQYLGGEPATKTAFANGNFTSTAELKGARKFHIGPGDMVLIPPSTWHQTVADAGQTLSYNMINIDTPRPAPGGGQ